MARPTAPGPATTPGASGTVPAMRLVIARNPDPDSSLPYLLRVPVDGGLLLKARDTWPPTALAEEWAYRWLGAAYVELASDDPAH